MHSYMKGTVLILVCTEILLLQFWMCLECDCTKRAEQSFTRVLAVVQSLRLWPSVTAVAVVPPKLIAEKSDSQHEHKKKQKKEKRMFDPSKAAPSAHYSFSCHIYHFITDRKWCKNPLLSSNDVHRDCKQMRTGFCSRPTETDCWMELQWGWMIDITVYHRKVSMLSLLRSLQDGVTLLSTLQCHQLMLPSFRMFFLHVILGFLIWKIWEGM